MKIRFTLSILLIALLAWPALAGPPAQPLDENAGLKPVLERLPIDRAPGDPVNFGAVLAAGATYLQAMQADVTDDNAGNGTNGVNETPDDPDDAGWDWLVNLSAPLHHTTTASPTNIYGATAQGLLAAYGVDPQSGYFTALTDAATAMVASANIRTSSDMIVLMEYDDLPAVSGSVYADAARAKYDARIAAQGSATAFAVYLRDLRGVTQGYPNGIIGWDLGAYAKVAAMLDARYPGNGYDTQADDIAEVLWQDSFNDSPGLFDVVDDAGWDPTWTDVNFWWYTLGLSGLIDAFHASNTYTTEIAGLVARLEASTFSNGAVSGSYGAHATDEDWQSTAYVAMSLAYLDQPSHQAHINRMAYWIGATQDATGAWVYSGGDHYPEIGGECTAALALGEAPTTVLVDDDFLSQTEVDAYNAIYSTAYVYGYDAFASIQAGIDAVSGSTVNVAAGTYTEQLHITTTGLTLVGAGIGATIVKSPASLPAYFITDASTQNHPVIFVDGATGVAISGLTIDGDHQGTANYRFSGLAFWNAGGSLASAEVVNIMDTAFSGAQHGVGIYAYNDTDGPYTIVLNGVSVLDFQKTAVALSGDGLTVDLDNVVTVGEGPTTVTAQNGIQVGYGASGTLNDCDISLITYTGPTWTATGLLLQAAGTVTATNVDIDACQTSVYWIDSNGSYDGGTITNPVGDAYYAYSTGLAKSAQRPRVAAQPLTEDYEAAGGRSAVTAAVTNSTITGTGLTDSWGVTAFSEADGPVDFTVTGCTIDNWDWGVVCYDFDAILNDVINAEIHDNNLVGNTSYGAYAYTSNIQDATGNWWGHASGPYHPTANPFGQGDPVSDNVDFDPFAGQATLAMTPVSSGPINCSQASTLTFTYTPDMDTPPLRGYTIRVTATPEVSFTAADIVVDGNLVPEDEVVQILYNGPNDYTIDYAILGTTGGVTGPDSFFDVTFHGDNDGADGTATVAFGNCALRDLNNQPIGADCSAWATILVDCLAPNAPTMVPEPTYTKGITNVVSWGLVATGAAYYVEAATDAAFTSPANSGWLNTPTVSTGFTGLTDGQIYYYRVKARDLLLNVSAWSGSVSSTQDDTSPLTAVSTLAALHNAAPFDVAWTGADVDPGSGDFSGLASVDLFYRYNGGAWTNFGTHTTSPINFTDAASDGLYEFYTLGIDAVGNIELDTGAADAMTVLDTTAPTGTFVINNDAAFTNTTSVTLNNVITDALSGIDQMRFSNDNVTFSDWETYAAIKSWTLPAGDSSKTVYAEFSDLAGNVYQVNDVIILDTTAPGAVSSPTATTGHTTVTLTWDPSSVGEPAALEVWRAVWNKGAGFELISAYPEYSDDNADQPTAPTDRADAATSAEWELLTTVASGSTGHIDTETDRGIYYYVVIPIDLALNPGPPSAMVYAKNYHLGDVQIAYDGDVDAGDITVLGTAYGTFDGDGSGFYNNECDVGPTTDASGNGFPLTDNIVGFEDLMIFALNYGNVGPAPVVQGSDIAMLSWFMMEEGRWGLGLTEPCANLKALQLKAVLPAGALAQLEGGSLLNQQAGPIFLRQIPGDGLDVSLAILGEGLVFSGQGLLFSVTLPAGMLPGDIELTVRDATNAELVFALSQTAVEDLPTVYRLAGSYPNPFNPKTAISFDLPEAQFVRLAIFSADGRRIATLLNERMAAGRHSATWDGRDTHGDQVASGIYFARIEAGPLAATHKMLLMK